MSDEASRPTVRVLIADAISEKGIELLRSTPGFEVTVKIGMSPDELKKILGDHEALIIRSATKVTADVLGEPGRLRAIGRAGTGVDNIDLDAATRAGVVVMNTPGGNSVAAAELTLAHLLAMARNVPQANAELREGRWERKKYMGEELSGKSLGVVGLGRIGREVARRALAFRMDVLGYDPYVTGQAAEDFGVRYSPLNELISTADFITLHLPVSDATRHMIDADSISTMKKGARLINCARGGLIDEAALLDAIESGHLAGAALDVFESEPPSDLRLVQHPRVVATPHLGASTREAQERVGTEIAAKIRTYLQKEEIHDAVNFPNISDEDSSLLRPVMELAERMGAFLAQVVDGGFERFEVRTSGTFGEFTLKPIVMAAAKGLMAPVVEGGVSYVNSLTLAGERGVTIEESRTSKSSAYAGRLKLVLHTDKESTTVEGTVFGSDRPRMVRVDKVAIECRPDGHMLFVRNRDVPGVVGRIGSILGSAGINIAGIRLGRPNGDDIAVSIIKVDSAVPAEALAELRSADDILVVRSVRV